MKRTINYLHDISATIFVIVALMCVSVPSAYLGFHFGHWVTESTQWSFGIALCTMLFASFCSIVPICTITFKIFGKNRTNLLSEE